MTRKKRIFALVLAAMMLVTLLAGCTGGGGSSQATGGTSTGGADTPASTAASGDEVSQAANDVVDTGEYEETVYLGVMSDIESADPYATTRAPVRVYTNSTFRTLTFNNYDTKTLDMVLAESVEDVSGDNSSFEVKLKSGVTFHNGAVLTAEDVKFTWDYCKDAANVVLVIPNAEKMVKECVVVDDLTVRFDLNYPIADFPTQLEIKIYSKEAFDTLPKEEAGLIGCGPYKYGGWRTGIDFTLERFDDYFEGTEEFKSKYIVSKVIPEASSLITALESGDVDAALTVTATQVPLIEANPGLVLESRLALQPYFIHFNYRKEHSNNLKYRQAIAHAINKDDVITIQCNNGIGGQKSNNFCPPDAFGYVELEGYPYDPEEAKRLLEESGVGDLGELKIAIYSTLKPTAEILQSCLADIGVSAKIEEVNPAEWVPYRKERDFDFFIDYAGYSGALLYNFDRHFSKNGTSNFTGYFDQEFEDLMTAASTAPTYDDMLSEFAVMQEWVGVNIPLVPLYTSNVLSVRRDYVQGMKVMPVTTTQEDSWIYIPKGARTL